MKDQTIGSSSHDMRSNDQRFKNSSTCPDAVHAALSRYPAKVSQQLLQLRKLVIQTHSKTASVGELVEGLRWGQPSYMTRKPETGTAIRLGMSKCGRPAMFFHCQTTLIATIRSHYLPVFDFEGNRALVLSSSLGSTKAELTHCIQLALTYKVTKT